MIIDKFRVVSHLCTFRPITETRTLVNFCWKRGRMWISGPDMTSPRCILPANMADRTCASFCWPMAPLLTAEPGISWHPCTVLPDLDMKKWAKNTIFPILINLFFNLNWNCNRPARDTNRNCNFNEFIINFLISWLSFSTCFRFVLWLIK